MPFKNESGNKQERHAGARPVPRRPMLARSKFADHELLLLSLVRRDAPFRVSADLLARLSDPGYRSAFHAVASGHGVIGLALTALRRCEAFLTLDRETRDEILAPLRPFAFQTALWDAERDRLLEVLRGHCLIPLVLKGGALRLTVYSEAAERLSGDLDLLVPAHRVRDGLEALARAGYVDHWTNEARSEHLRRGYHLELSHENGFKVELHWDLAPRGEGFRFDSAAFLNRSFMHEREGAAPVRVPAPEHMVLHLAAQNREDSFSRLKRLVDIDRVIAATVASGGGMDWDYVVRQARYGGLQTVVGLAFQLSRRLLDTPVLPDAVLDLELPRIVRFHVSLLRPEAYVLTQQAFRSTVARRALHFWLMPGWRSRAKWARRLVGGSTNPMAHVYSERRGVVINQTLRARSVRSWKLLKVGAYHLILYAAALRAVVADRSGGRLDFWPSGSPRAGRYPTIQRLSKGAPWTSPANTTS